MQSLVPQFRSRVVVVSNRHHGGVRIPTKPRLRQAQKKQKMPEVCTVGVSRSCWRNHDYLLGSGLFRRWQELGYVYSHTHTHTHTIARAVGDRGTQVVRGYMERVSHKDVSPNNIICSHTRTSPEHIGILQLYKTGPNSTGGHLLEMGRSEFSSIDILSTFYMALWFLSTPIVFFFMYVPPCAGSWVRGE